MGMSGDYQVAVEEGATYVRIWERRSLERVVAKMALTKNIAFLGAGQMAEALVGGLVAAQDVTLRRCGPPILCLIAEAH